MTKEQASKIGWLMYRISQFREDIKQVEWHSKGALYKKLFDDITENIILNGPK